LKLLAFWLVLGRLLAAQSVEVYSEFQPFGRAPEAPEPREIISPAVARNGFATFRVLVNAPPGTSFFLFCQTNPPDIVQARLYKVALPSGGLEPVRSPNFGVVPEGASSRAYLLDVWIPRDAEAGRRVRLELQLKIGDWVVYPMELRIQKATVPFAGSPLASPESLAEALARNRRQDQAFEDLLQLPEVWFLTAQHIANQWTAHSPLSAADDAEWYLKARDLLYRRANWR